MLVFAPTSAGKTHFVKHNPRRAVDGDDVVARTIGWPKVPRWWEDAAIRDEFNPRANEAVIAYAASHPELIVLFNTDPVAIDYPALVARGVDVRIFLPPLDIMLRNAELKRSEQAATGRKIGQPTDYESVRRSWEAWMNATRAWGVTPTPHVPRI